SQYPIQNSTNFSDLSESLDEFLKIDSNNVNDIAYTATQLAMLHLRREIDRTIELVIESNDLRAYYEFQNKVMKTGVEPKEELDAEVVVNKKSFGKIFLAGFVMISFVILYFNRTVLN